MTVSHDPTQAAEQAADAAVHPTVDLVERLARRLGGKASVAAVFGEPIDREGVTVIPVAALAVGFGGGGSKEAKVGKSGDGGGGGAVTRPIGFIEIAGGTAVFKPVRDPMRDVVVPMAAVLATTALVRISRVLTRRGRR